MLLYGRGHTLHLLKHSSAVSESKVTGMEAGDHLFSCILCEQRGLQEENKGIEMRHFCPPELDFLWKIVRRVRGSGSHTYTHVVWHVSRWVTTSSQAENQPRGEKALVRETSVPPTTSWGGECYLKLLGFTNLPVELRWTCCTDAPTMQQWLSRGAGAGSLLP